MEIRTRTGSQEESRSVPRSLIGGPGFDAVFLSAVIWFQVGGWSDAWAHHHIPQLETFLTPWHGILYSGFLVTALVLLIAVTINRFRGASWGDAIPRGYALSLLGVAGFIVGGVGDAIWHTLFGVEQSVDAQFSPSHLTLLLFGCMFLLGPFRAVYQRRAETVGSKVFLTVTVILLLMLFNINTQTYHPFVFLWPTTTPKADMEGQLLAIVAIFFQSAILTSVILYLIRRWHTYFGFFTIVITASSIPLAFMEDHYLTIASAVLAGILIDVAYVVLKPSVTRVLQLRTFAAVAAGGFYLMYILMLQFTIGIVWTIHLAGGAVTTSALVGWLLTYLLVPVSLDEETTQ